MRASASEVSKTNHNIEMKLKHIVCALIISLGAVCPVYAGPVEAKADARALVEAGAEAVGEWAQVRIPAASIRTEGRHAAEMSTQPYY